MFRQLTVLTMFWVLSLPVHGAIGVPKSDLLPFWDESDESSSVVVDHAPWAGTTRAHTTININKRRVILNPQRTGEKNACPFIGK